jgi:uncharacterized membrane protein
VKKYFLTGLIILLPIAITIAIVSWIINFFTGPFVTIVSSSLEETNLATNGFLFLSHDQVVLYSAKFLILICLFFLIIGLGMLTRWYFIRGALTIGDKLLHRIPVFNTVYKTTKEIIKTLFNKDGTAFKQVVLVPFPRKDMYTLGLISGSAPTVCSTTFGSKLISVFIPTTPNPTSGFLIMFKQEDLIYLEMKPEDAIKYIISCGAIVPEERVLL